MRTILLTALVLSAANIAYADPKTDYLLYCRGCHLANGEGVPPEVPTLHDELGKLAALPGGRDYLIRVPGVSQTPLDDEKLAAVLNWVMAEFNSAALPDNYKPFTAREVGKSRVNVLENPLEARAKILGDPI